MTDQPISITELREATYEHGPQRVTIEVRELAALLDVAEAAAPLLPRRGDPANAFIGDPHGILDELRALDTALARFTFGDPT